MYNIVILFSILQFPFWLLGVVIGGIFMPIYRGFIFGSMYLQVASQHDSERIAMDKLDELTREEEDEDHISER